MQQSSLPLLTLGLGKRGYFTTLSVGGKEVGVIPNFRRTDVDSVIFDSHSPSGSMLGQMHQTTSYSDKVGSYHEAFYASLLQERRAFKHPVGRTVDGKHYVPVKEYCAALEDYYQDPGNAKEWLDVITEIMTKEITGEIKLGDWVKQLPGQLPELRGFSRGRGSLQGTGRARFQLSKEGETVRLGIGRPADCQNPWTQEIDIRYNFTKNGMTTK